MGLHVAAHAPDMVFEQPARRIERIANGDIDVLVGMVLRPGMTDEDVLPRHADVDAYIVELALVVMSVGRLDDDLATDDPVMEVLELGGLFRIRASIAGDGSMP